MEKRDRFRGCLLGLAVGDCVGSAVEFQPTGTFSPVTDMIGGGPFRLAPGEFTDDTSMALCLASSLVENNAFDASDQMRRYVKWRREGYFSSKGYCFDCGSTVSGALSRFQSGGNPYAGSTDRNLAGNGSLMRLAPVPMFYSNKPISRIAEMCAKSSITTHGAPQAVDACLVYGTGLALVLRGENPCSVQQLMGQLAWNFRADEEVQMAIWSAPYISEKGAKGTGYVVSCLQSALWAFYHTTNYRDAVLAATNLGNDSDTTAAVVGMLAGAFYGVESIPSNWLEKLVMRDKIEYLADELYRLSGEYR